MNKICINVNSGMTCRLKSIFSYYMFCKKNNMELCVIWNIDDSTPGHFLDYFENINGITFVESYSNAIYLKIGKGHPYEMYNFDNLKLLPYLKNIILSNIQKMNKYISVHIRRTDFKRLAFSQRIYMDDCEFEDFINKNNDYNVYIATDNAQTQEKFYNLYKDKIKVIYFINKSNQSTRKTTLEHSIIDLCMCINSEKFFGTRGSSYTNFITHCREYKNNFGIND